MPFFDEIYEDPDINFILVRHEQSAGHAAEGYAAASGKLGLCVTTSGPGATNIITPLADAYYDSRPILAFSGQVPTSLIGNDAFQEADLVGSTMSFTKNNYQVKDVNDLGRIMKEGIFIATTGRPGPVFIDLPKDVQKNICTIDNPIPEKVEVYGYNPKVFSKAAPRQIKRAIDMLLNAKYPAIIAGHGILLSNAQKEMQELTDLMPVPIVYTILAKGIISDSHPYALGMLGMHGRKRANFAISEADVVLAIGCRFSDRITGDLSKFPGQPDAKIIHIDIDTTEIGKNVKADVPIVADAKLALQEMIDQLKARLKRGENFHSWWPKFIKGLKAGRGIPNVTKRGPTGLIFPEKVMFEINKVLKPKDIVATEVGQNQMYAAHYLNLTCPRTFITSGGLGTMGFGLPAAIGAKVAKPDEEVWLIAGDGSIQMNLHEFATVKQHKIKLNVVILNNGYLGMVRQWQELFHEKRYAGTSLYCTEEDGSCGYYPDFVKLAEAYGLKGLRVSDPEKIQDALQQSLASDETFIIEILCEPESNILPMLSPGGSLSSFYSRRKEHKDIYDWYRRLPRTQMELKDYSIEMEEDDDINVYFEEE